jgi:hypothetical protein
LKLPKIPFERSRWRGGRCACDTCCAMGFHNVLNRPSPRSTNSRTIYTLQAIVLGTTISGPAAQARPFDKPLQEKVVDLGRSRDD